MSCREATKTIETAGRNCESSSPYCAFAPTHPTISTYTGAGGRTLANGEKVCPCGPVFHPAVPSSSTQPRDGPQTCDQTWEQSGNAALLVCLSVLLPRKFIDHTTSVRHEISAPSASSEGQHRARSMRPYPTIAMTAFTSWRGSVRHSPAFRSRVNTLLTRRRPKQAWMETGRAGFQVCSFRLKVRVPHSLLP